MITIVAWTLVVLFAGLALFLWVRSFREEGSPALRGLAEELRTGRVSAAPSANEPVEVAELRSRIAEGWVPRGRERSAAGDEALVRIARYLREAVVRPLDGAGGDGGALEEAAAQALDALADLEFFTRVSEEEVRADNLTQAIQEVTREFALEYGVPVKLRGPDSPVRGRYARESLKDAVYLLLVNAARFGGDRTVEVELVAGSEGPGLRVLDRGRGFSEEALRKAMEPFFTTEDDSLGLGLTHVRQVVEGFGGRVRVGNREGGGGEVEVRLPPAP